MTALTLEQFGEYFEALHVHPPYPWQERLAERAVNGGWPGAIDLPTGSGKTACIDVAVFALACQASQPIEKRTAPRRVFFCVNRRVIVDEAHGRAQRIAKAIWEAENGTGVLADVAAALRIVARGPLNTERNPQANSKHQDAAPPLDVLELRGGIYRDNRWARSITQPTIVCTTIDQLGSRLLFRGYGVSTRAAPIQAALIAYDSLVLLDEAHISEPFRQTLDHVTRYLDPDKWAEQRVGIKPAIVVPMTATPNSTMQAKGVIKLETDDRIVESLNNRLSAGKPAELREVKDVTNAAVESAINLANDRPTAVGVIVNRVATAKAIYRALVDEQSLDEKKRRVHADAAIELVIGSMRPIDRDAQAERLRGFVGPDRPAVTGKTSFIVATQCLEVGADYDFDTLVTECASLDALRQRFGRLNRAGRKDAARKPIDAKAVILIDKIAVKTEDDIKKAEQSKDANKQSLDPIYGNALARAWNWLNKHSTDENGGDTRTKKIDFGIDAFDVLLKKHGENGRIPSGLLAPSASLDAPVLLPAYVDFWCQTAPRPVPDPEVSLFVHGPQRGQPDVQLCWRADLIEDERDDWCDVVTLLPPTSAECMSVPISRARRWLAYKTDRPADGGDMLGVATDDESDEKKIKSKPEAKTRHGVLWHGAKDSTLIRSPDDLRPGDTLVLPISAGGWAELGHIPPDARSGQANRAASDSKPRGSASGTGETTATNDLASETADSAKKSAMVETNHARIDVAEDAFQTARDRAALRLHPSLRKRLPEGDAVEELFDRARDRENPPTVAEWRELLTAAAESVAGESDDLKEKLQHLACAEKGLIRECYMDGRGVVLMTRKRIGAASAWFLPPLDEGDDESSRTRREQPVPLKNHTGHVVNMLNGSLPLLPLSRLADSLERAAQLHDWGKADERFQAMLRRTDRTDAWLMSGVTSALLAKSDGVPMTRSQHHAARRRAGLPNGFRHEMLSVQLAECSGHLPDDPTERDLVLHLIAAHHGHARPFAPVVSDEELPDVEVDGHPLSHDQREHLVPPHRLDSGIAERFWSLTRRYGWWGLAYLEAVLRLADQQASAAEDAGDDENAETNDSAEAIA